MNHTITLIVNDDPHQLVVASQHTLLHVLRRQLKLTGAKQACSGGACGACSVVLNDQIVNACLVLAVEADGAEVHTVEGLADGDHLHALQQAFLDHTGTQCGFCASGMLMAASVLLKRSSRPSDEEIRAALAGNLCRCTGYADIIKAIQAAARSRR